MASRGTRRPLFIEQIQSGKALTITDPQMTRYMMSIQDAVDLVIFAFEMQSRAICSFIRPRQRRSAMSRRRYLASSRPRIRSNTSAFAMAKAIRNAAYT